VPTAKQVFDVIKDSILELKDLAEDDVHPDAELKDLGLDSLDFVEVQVILKRRFGVQVQAGAFAEGRIRSLQEFAEHVLGLVATA
jgi:acyl carrier protein